jgi:DNA invertase Pin-like site-specific DNA recombinase
MDSGPYYSEPTSGVPSMMSPNNPTDQNPASTCSAQRRPGRPVKPIDMQRVRELRAQGLSLRQIARLTGVSKSSIWTAIRRLAMASSDMSNNP